MSQQVCQGWRLQRALNLNEGAALLVNRSLPRMEHAEKPIRLYREGAREGRGRSQRFPNGQEVLRPQKGCGSRESQEKSRLRRRQTPPKTAGPHPRERVGASVSLMNRTVRLRRKHGQNKVAVGNQQRVAQSIQQHNHSQMCSQPGCELGRDLKVSRQLLC